MSVAKPDLLATFVERHRADFDVHEPRPDLWAAIETRLHPEVPAPGLRLTTDAFVAPLPISTGAAPVVAPLAPWWQRYGVAAGLAVLVSAAGLSEAWKSRHPDAHAANRRVAETAASANPVTPTAPADAALYVGPDPAVQAASLRPGTAGDSQLTAAVRGLEAYYSAQLAPRRAALLRLDTARTGTPAAWRQQLTSLDASYRQLRQELWQHPQPEMLLSAMNRNLQVRLDLLDQQLRRSTVAARDATAGRASGSYLVADSRRQP